MGNRPPLMTSLQTKTSFAPTSVSRLGVQRGAGHCISCTTRFVPIPLALVLITLLVCSLLPIALIFIILATVVVIILIPFAIAIITGLCALQRTFVGACMGEGEVP